VQDETDGCELHAFKYFNFVEVNDVIRLRSFKVADGILVMNKHSNILKIPPLSEYYQNFLNKIAAKMKMIEPNMDIPMFTFEKSEDVMMNIIESPTSFGVMVVNEEKTPLKRINEITIKDTRVVLELNIIDIYPQPVSDMVMAFCKKCLGSFYTKDYSVEELKPKGVFFCKFCSKQDECTLYYNAVLYGRENVYSNKIIKLFLSTFDNEGLNFFGIPPVDLYRSSDDYSKMKDIIRRLTDKDCFISVMVEAIPTGHEENERIFRIVGSYKNNLLY